MESNTIPWLASSGVLVLMYWGAATLDNNNDMQQRHAAEHKQWERFINSCRPLEYDKLGRVVTLQCLVNQDKG